MRWEEGRKVELKFCLLNSWMYVCSFFFCDDTVFCLCVPFSFCFCFRNKQNNRDVAGLLLNEWMNDLLRFDSTYITRSIVLPWFFLIFWDVMWLWRILGWWWFFDYIALLYFCRKQATKNFSLILWTRDYYFENLNLPLVSLRWWWRQAHKKKAHNASDATASTIGNHIILCVTYLFLRISIGLLVREIL
jgi:hypothetical protein